MFEWLDANPVFWPLFIIAARVVDVSIGTVRTIMIVRGMQWTAAVLGFFEIVIWVTAVSGVLVQVTVVKIVSYGLGFALGNAAGVWIDGKLALGQQMLLMVSRGQAHDVAFALRMADYIVTELPAKGGRGDVALTAVIVPRRETRRVMRIAREADPDVFITVQDVRATSALHRALAPAPTGWRAVLKKK